MNAQGSADAINSSISASGHLGLIMRQKLARAFWIAMLLAIAVFGARLIYVVQQTETGWDTLLADFKRAALLGFAESPPGIEERDPAEQADFWLKEVDRIVSEHPKDAELFAGAALTLDTPCKSFYARHLKKLLPVGGTNAPIFDQERIDEQNAIYEERVHRRCLDLIARATELEPENVQWWRLRAVLQIGPNSDSVPRDENWPQTLQLCAEHDPGNALYDYLAARFLWKPRSRVKIDLDSDNLKELLTIEDPQTFRRGDERFEHGQTMRFIAGGEQTGLAAVRTFLRQSKAPVPAWEKLLNDRNFGNQTILIAYGVIRRREVVAQRQLDHADFDGALTTYHQNLHVVSQWMDGNRIPIEYSLKLRYRILSQQMAMFNQHPGLFTAEEIDQVRAESEEVNLELEVYKAAAQRLLAAGVIQGRNPADWFTLKMWFGSRVSSTFLMALLVAGAVAFLASRSSTQPGLPVIGFWGCLAAFVVVAGLTGGWLGIVPVELDSSQQNTIWACAGGLLLAAVWLYMVAWLIRRRYQGKRGSFSLLGLLGVLTMLAILGAVLHELPKHFSWKSIDLSVRPADWDEMNVEVAETILSTNATGLWYLQQWIAHAGPAVTVALWCVAVGILTAIKFRRRSKSGVGTEVPPRKILILSAWGRSLRRPILALAAIAMLCYLISATWVVGYVEQQFQDKMTFHRNPDGYWEKVEQALDEVRADETLMQRLRADAAAQVEWDLDQLQ